MFVIFSQRLYMHGCHRAAVNRSSVTRRLVTWINVGNLPRKFPDSRPTHCLTLLLTIMYISLLVSVIRIFSSTHSFHSVSLHIITVEFHCFCLVLFLLSDFLIFTAFDWVLECGVSFKQNSLNKQKSNSFWITSMKYMHTSTLRSVNHLSLCKLMHAFHACSL